MRKQEKWQDSTQFIRESAIHYTYLGQRFIPIEQFRAVEFDRDWNIRGQQLNGAQLQLALEQKWLNSQKGQVQLKLENFQIDTNFSGQKFYSEGAWKNNGWHRLQKWFSYQIK